MDEMQRLTSTIKQCRKWYGELNTTESIFSIGACFSTLEQFIEFCKALPTKYAEEHGDGETFLEYLQCYEDNWILIAYEYVMKYHRNEINEPEIYNESI